MTRYPDGNGFALKKALALRFGVTLEQVVLGNGSNDILELATQAFLRPGDEAIFSQHAFAVYPLATRAYVIATPSKSAGGWRSALSGARLTPSSAAAPKRVSLSGDV